MRADVHFVSVLTAPCVGLGGLTGTPRLAGWDTVTPPVSFAQGVDSAVITPWGPSGAFTTQSFIDWTRPRRRAAPPEVDR